MSARTISDLKPGDLVVIGERVDDSKIYTYDRKFSLITVLVVTKDYVTLANGQKFQRASICTTNQVRHNLSSIKLWSDPPEFFKEFWEFIVSLGVYKEKEVDIIMYSQKVLKLEKEYEENFQVPTDRG